MSVELTWVDPDDPGAWKAAIRPNTKAFFGETIGNPGGNVLDIETIAAIAHEHGLPLLVDNTFATPFLCRPFEWGADIVLHSATKFIGGHGTSIGGVVVESGQFNWSNGRFPVVAEPSPAYHGLQFHETFGTYGYLMKLRAETLRDLGAAMSPFNAFLFLQGLETLSLRMERHAANAFTLAQELEGHPAIERVTYPFLNSHPQHTLARTQMSAGGGVVTLRLRSYEAARRFIDALQLCSHSPNLGDSRTIVTHPASTTHSKLTEEERQRVGITPGLIRISVGLEAITDVLADVDRALGAA
jgi:O-acetylhomoserine (thiol)-lyase